MFLNIGDWDQCRRLGKLGICTSPCTASAKVARLDLGRIMSSEITLFALAKPI